MSVIITGMDMQDNCRFCPARETYEDRSYCNNMLSKHIDIDLDNTKPKWCPLKSAEGLIAQIQKEIDKDIGGNDPDGVEMYKTGLREAVEWIKDYCEVEEWEQVERHYLVINLKES